LQLDRNKGRKRLRPRFRRDAGHEFEDAVVNFRECTLFTADFGDSFLHFLTGPTVKELKRATPNPSAQLSIRPIQLKEIWPSVLASAPLACQLLTPTDAYAISGGDADCDPDPAQGDGAPFQPMIQDTRLFHTLGDRTWHGLRYGVSQTGPRGGVLCPA
jgi:hypothetical protein